MSNGRKPDETLDEYLRGDSEVSRAYRATASESPPAALDARILAEARGHRRFTPFGNRWVMPLAAAAVVVLSVGLVTFMSERGAVPELPAPAETASAPAPSAPSAKSGESRAREGVAAQPDAVKREMPQAVKPSQTRDEVVSAPAPAAAPEEKRAAPLALAARHTPLADIVSVEVSGKAGAYQFNVGIRSPDTGCAQYADWWEVVSEDGRLLYRRVLAHSHADEQPFTRVGGPVPVAADTPVWVRAHMHPGGYGGQAYQGSVKDGFRPATPAPGFAASLANVAPLPDGCAF
jgi:hypothetical protein